jgi:hypothetical protein
MMRMRAGFMVLALALAACGTDDGVEGESTLPADAVADTADTLSAAQQTERRQRAVSESGLPGARGIGGALDAAAAADARNAAHDTMLQ